MPKKERIFTEIVSLKLTPQQKANFNRKTVREFLDGLQNPSSLSIALKIKAKVKEIRDTRVIRNGGRKQTCQKVMEFIDELILTL